MSTAACVRRLRRTRDPGAVGVHDAVLGFFVANAHEKVARASDPRRAHRIRIAVRSAATATYARTMNSLTIKLPAALERELALASQREHLTKSELVRRAVAAYVARPPGIGPFVSALEQAGDLVGCFKGGPKDLASNPKHMAKFGQP